jgi:DNA-binding FadR family transcriptional regulator
MNRQRAPKVMPSSRRWETLVRALVARIVSGELAPGAAFPTEPSLALEFGVSRTVVREALKILEEKGLVDIQHGRGTRVEDQRRWNLLDATVLGASLDHDPLSSLFEDLTTMRMAIECEAAASAATRISDAQLATMKALVSRLKAAMPRPDDYLEGDLAFHRLILEASGNRLALAIMDAIEQPLRSSRRITNRLPGGIVSGQRFHERIFACLRRRDPKAAAQAMRDHLEWARKHWRARAKVS